MKNLSNKHHYLAGQILQIMIFHNIVDDIWLFILLLSLSSSCLLYCIVIDIIAQKLKCYQPVVS
jgi:hypothetical protein